MNTYIDDPTSSRAPPTFDRQKLLNLFNTPSDLGKFKKDPNFRKMYIAYKPYWNKPLVTQELLSKTSSYLVQPPINYYHTLTNARPAYPYSTNKQSPEDSEEVERHILTFGDDEYSPETILTERPYTGSQIQSIREAPMLSTKKVKRSTARSFDRAPKAMRSQSLVAFNISGNENLSVEIKTPIKRASPRVPEQKRTYSHQKSRRPQENGGEDSNMSSACFERQSYVKTNQDATLRTYKILHHKQGSLHSSRRKNIFDSEADHYRRVQRALLKPNGVEITGESKEEQTLRLSARESFGNIHRIASLRQMFITEPRPSIMSVPRQSSMQRSALKDVSHNSNLSYQVQRRQNSGVFTERENSGVHSQLKAAKTEEEVEQSFKKRDYGRAKVKEAKEALWPLDSLNAELGEPGRKLYTKQGGIFGEKSEDKYIGSAENLVTKTPKFKNNINVFIRLSTQKTLPADREISEQKTAKKPVTERSSAPQRSRSLKRKVEKQPQEQQSLPRVAKSLDSASII